MILVNPDEVRRRTYYHESGHAIAAVIRHGYVTSVDLDLSMIVETSTNLKKADEAFMVWAGPWAQAYWEGGCTVARIMELFETQSWFDWPVYEEARDPQRAAEMDVRGAAQRAEAAYLFGDPKPANLPPVSPPDSDWHGELTNAWPAIERLAASMLGGQPSIHLGNGQELIRDENRDYDYWWDPTGPTVEEDETTP